MGADSPPYPHAPPRREGYRFVPKMPLRVILLTLAITRRGSLFGKHSGFVSPALFCFDLFLWDLPHDILKWGLTRPHVPHAPPRREGYRFVHTRLCRRCSPLAITRRGSLFGKHSGFVSPALFCFGLFLWDLPHVILNGAKHPHAFGELCLSLHSFVCTGGGSKPPPYNVNAPNFRPCQQL